MSDYAGYYALAHRLITEGEYTRFDAPTAFRTPGYPGFLAAGMVVSHSYRWLALMNVVLSVAAIPLTWWFARRLRLGSATAMVAAGLVAVTPTFVLWSPVLGSEHLQIVLLLAAWSVLCTTTTSRHAVLAGVLYGVGVLVRPETLFFLAAVPFLIRLAVPYWRRVMALSSITFVVTVGCVAPWYVRNEVVVGRGAGISTTGGLNFYLAHREDGYRYIDPARTPLAGLDELDTSKKGYTLGFEALRANPAGLVRTTARSSYELLRPPVYAAYYSTRRQSPSPHQAGVSASTVKAATRASIVGWVITISLVPIGIVALFATRYRRELAAIGALLAANWVCFAVVFWGMPRYRYSVEPLVSVLAACGITALTRAVRARRRL